MNFAMENQPKPYTEKQLDELIKHTKHLYFGLVGLSIFLTITVVLAPFGVLNYWHALTIEKAHLSFKAFKETGKTELLQDGLYYSGYQFLVQIIVMVVTFIVVVITAYFASISFPLFFSRISEKLF